MPKKRNQKKGTPMNDLSGTHLLIDTTKDRLIGDRWNALWSLYKEFAHFVLD